MAYVHESPHTVEEFLYLPEGSLVYYNFCGIKVYGKFIKVTTEFKEFASVYAYWQPYHGDLQFGEIEDGIGYGWVSHKQVHIEKPKELIHVIDPQFEKLYV